MWDEGEERKKGRISHNANCQACHPQSGLKFDSAQFCCVREEMFTRNKVYAHAEQISQIKLMNLESIPFVADRFGLY
jgi:cytochrome c